VITQPLAAVVSRGQPNPLQHRAPGAIEHHDALVQKLAQGLLAWGLLAQGRLAQGLLGLCLLARGLLELRLPALGLLVARLRRSCP
jgi:hypothetical protein